MIILALGLVMTAGLFAVVGYRGGTRATDLGTMSHQWVSAYRAAEPASSM